MKNIHIKAFLQPRAKLRVLQRLAHLIHRQVTSRPWNFKRVTCLTDMYLSLLNRGLYVKRKVLRQSAETGDGACPTNEAGNKSDPRISLR